MPKINQEEYGLLKGLDDEWKWIARNNMFGSKFEAHTSRPYKMVDSHWSNGDMTLELLEGEYLFQFIQWEDEEPHNIAELIGEYEREEAEVKKDIEWLKEETSEILLTSKKDGTNYFYYRDLKEKIYSAIDQLDKPESLSEEWIGQKSIATHVDTTNGDIRVTFILDDLQNAIVPKQEKVKIESVWAEDIENAKARGMTLFKTMKWMAIDSEDKEKQDLFARAWLYGYTVKKEPKYFAKIKGHENIVSDDKYWNYYITDESLFIDDNKVHPDVLGEYVLSATKDDWENMGINDDNADFVEVEELEEKKGSD